MSEHRRSGKGRGPKHRERPKFDAESLANASAEGVRFFNEIFTLLGKDVQAQASKGRADSIVLRLGGTQLDGLKRRPELISALALLTSQSVSRSTGQYWQCIFDLDGQLEAREALLRSAAGDIATAVLRNGRRAVLEGLTNTERRLVHQGITDDGRVATWSEGEGADRRLNIARNA